MLIFSMFIDCLRDTKKNLTCRVVAFAQKWKCGLEADIIFSFVDVRWFILYFTFYSTH